MIHFIRILNIPQGARILLADAICVPGNDSMLMDIDSRADFSKAAAILESDDQEICGSLT